MSASEAWALAHLEQPSPTQTERLERLLDDVAVRDGLYRLMPWPALASHRPLLLELFAREMAYRDALWHGRASDDGDFFENIYWCGLLLFSVAKAQDALVVWRARRLNMDVGSMLDARFMVGAGVTQTIAFLRSSTDPDAPEALEYVLDWQRDGELAVHMMALWEWSQREYFGLGEGAAGP